MAKEIPGKLHPVYGELLLHMAHLSGLHVEKYLSESQITRARMRHSPRWFATALMKLQRVSDNTALQSGFEYGYRLDLASAGVIGQAVMTAPTLLHSMRLACKYYVLTGPELHFDFVSDEKYTTVTIHFNYINIPSSVRSFIFEALLGSWHRCAKILTGKPLRSKLIQLDYCGPPHSGLYGDRFHCDVEFECTFSKITLSNYQLNLPLITANSIIHERAVSTCEAALIKLVTPETVCKKVCNCLKTSKTLSEVTLESIAKHLNMSARTLSRRLNAEGYNFQELLDERRRKFACQLLTRSHWKLERIAEQVGYSDASNFRRAFKKWVGMTPSEFRSRL